ncbi:MAG: HDOD domain-containing protein [Deltaproteobacteria bacterium]|nr:HDOD domain-containing protein [Deltaproteobacteria bacterium]
MMERSELKRNIQRIKNLPTIPPIVAKISKMVESPTTSSADVGKVISQDQVLSAQILRMANSPFFGMSRKISSVTQALVILGFDVIKGLVLTSSVFEMMQKSIVGLWEHSIGSAATARVLANLVGQSEEEEVSVAGLLHDLGKVVMSVQLEDKARDEIVALVQKKKTSRYEAENEVLGFTHAQVGLWLAEHWKLPQSLAEPMCYHHQPEKARHAPKQTAIVHLANIIIRARGFGFGGDPYVPPLSKEAWELLGLKTDDFQDILEEMEPNLLNLADYY